KPQVVDKVEGTHAGIEEGLEFALVGLERLGGTIESASESGAGERLDLRTVVIGGHANLSVRLKNKGPHALPEAMTGTLKQSAPRLLKRERETSRRPVPVDLRRQGGPDLKA